MASHPRNSSQNQELNHENGVDADVLKRIIEGLNEIELTIDQLRQEFHKSLDLNLALVPLNLFIYLLCLDRIFNFYY